MRTTKTTKGTRTQTSTLVADLTSHKRIDSNNSNSFSFSLVLDKTLQLVEAPVADPIIHNLAPISFSYSFKVFHDYLVSIKVENNVFTDVVICPSHEPLLSARNFFKQSLSGLCAFSLKNRTQVLELPFDLFDFAGIIKLAIGCDCQVINSEIDAKNSILDIRAVSFDLFRECEQEETSSLIINPKQGFLNIPTEVLIVTIRNCERNFNSSLDCADRKNVISEGSTSWKVITDRTIVNQRLSLSSLNNSTRLFNTSNGKLGGHCLLQFSIDKWLKFNVVLNLPLPSLIDAELQSLLINFNCPDYFKSCNNFDFGCCSDVHNNMMEEQVYKLYDWPVTSEGVVKL